MIMDFKRYQHIVRYGEDDVKGIEKGICYIFPKIDGTNTCLWKGDGETIRTGSRKNEITEIADHDHFAKKALHDKRYIGYLRKYPTHRLFGEWLTPRHLRTYENTAWRKFYVFDVCVDNDQQDGGLDYLPYEEYKEGLEEFGIDFIKPLAVLENPTLDDFTALLDQNVFLIKEGQGCGEGIVIKNYAYKNPYNLWKWAKILSAEYKEKYSKHLLSVEDQIIMLYVTEDFITKEYAKLLENGNEWSKKMIPRLFNTVYHTLIQEEIWNVLKKFKNPKIDFGSLEYKVRLRIKEVLPDCFKANSLDYDCV